MAQWNELQRSFSAGEVGTRLIMRDDDAGHQNAVLEMQNFYPTLQGTAVRTPGTQYIYEVAESDSAVRIIPYLTPQNTKALIQITEGDMKVVDSLGLGINGEIGQGGVAWRNITPNYQCRDTFFPWAMTPQGTVVVDERELGWTIIPGRFSGFCRKDTTVTAVDVEKCIMDNECAPLPEDAPDGLLLQVDLAYDNNFSTENPEDELAAKIEIRDAPDGGGNLIHEIDLVEDINIQVGQTYSTLESIPGSFLANDVLYIRFWFEGLIDEGKDSASAPNFNVNQLGILAPVAVATIPDDVTGEIPPWLADELDDIQFIQSPYTDSAQGNLYGKQVVLTHGNHEPMELVFNGTSYELRKIFTNDDNQHYDQWDWDTRGYPAACSSYQGRLVLAGSTLDQTSNPAGTNSEKVWCTEVGQWFKFTDAASDTPSPADSVDFTAIYRSPIHWVAGQKSLLIGAESMEYAASADNIFAPNDLGVFMQSTHGSSRVQPMGFGAFVLFAGEAGRKLRAMQYVDEDQGWVAPDMALQHPTLFDSGIRRMVRMRNPHQMGIVVRNDGQVAILHYDTNADILGWSRLVLGDPVIDAAVLTDDNGADVLLLAVRRRINGVWKITIEGISNWFDGVEWVYLNNSVLGINNPNDNTITGLEHLEGAFVQVVGDGNYLGTHQVIGGEVTLVSGSGLPINVTWYNVGLANTARITTLPLVTQDPKSKKRYTQVSVRTLNSGRPIINGQRPADRDPASNMNQSQPRDIIRDNNVANMGSDVGQTITIEENLPVRSEIIGVFGKVAGNSV